MVYMASDNKSDKNNALVKGYLLMFVLLPIINQYMIGSMKVVQIYTYIGVMLWLLMGKDRKIDFKIVSYIIYAIIISCIGFSVVGSGQIVQLALRLAGFVFLILNFYIVFPYFCDREFILKWYSRIVGLVSLTLIIQYFIYKLSGFPFMLLLPNVTLNYNGGLNSTVFMNFAIGRIFRGYYYRPCSVFIEPVYQALYCLPFIVIKLFSSEKVTSKNILFALIVTVSMVLTTSSMAIAACTIVWIFFIMKIMSLRNANSIKSFLLILPIIALGVYFIATSEGVLTSVAIKADNIQNIDHSSSLTWRLFRGIECYKGIGGFQKIFGCGYGDVANYLNYIQLKTIYDTDLTLIDYMSGIFYMFCSIGIVGSTLMFSMIYPYLKSWKDNHEMKMLVICMLMACFSAAIFDTDKFFLFLGLIICSSTRRLGKNPIYGDIILAFNKKGLNPVYRNANMTE